MEVMGFQVDHTMLYAAALTLCSIALVQFLLGQVRAAARWLRVARGTSTIPRAPGGNVLLGNALQLAGNACPWGKMYEWVSEAGKCVRIRLGMRIGIVVADPHAMKRIFQTRQRLYTKDTDFSYRNFLPILGTGLVTSDGSHWQQQRLLMAPAFRIDMLDAILPISSRAVDRLSARLEAARGRAHPVDMEEEFRLLTLQVIGEAILSLTPEQCDAVLPHLFLPVMEESNLRTLRPWRHAYPLHVLRYNSRVRALDAFIANVIHRRRAQRASAAAAGRPAPARDIVDRILSALEARGEVWGPATERQLVFEIKTFLLAGHETSAAMLSWTLYELSLSPELRARVREEARAHLPQHWARVREEAAAGNKAATEVVVDSPEPARAEVEQMEYSLSCLKESLRKYSVVPAVTRNLDAPDSLCGYDLPKGSWIICHIQRIHHLYKNPLTWDPLRFMPGGEYDQFDEDIRPYMFLPFTAGPRNCLGQHFALLEARVLMGQLCERFDFKPVDAEKQGKTDPHVIPVGPVNGMPFYIS